MDCQRLQSCPLDAAGGDGMTAVHEANGHAPPVTVKNLAADKELPARLLTNFGLHDLASGGVGIPYFDGSGAEIAIKRRVAFKAKDGSFWPKGQRLHTYGDNRLDLAQRRTFLILVEGE